jgi:hypothetical protein
MKCTVSTLVPELYGLTILVPETDLNALAVKEFECHAAANIPSTTYRRLVVTKRPCST